MDGQDDSGKHNVGPSDKPVVYTWQSKGGRSGTKVQNKSGDLMTSVE